MIILVNIDSFLKTRYRVGALWILSLLLMLPLVSSFITKLEKRIID